MNGVAIMRALLLAHPPVTAIVGQQVFAGDVPADEPLPAIGIKEVDRVEMDTVSRDGQVTLVTARIQVTVYEKSYPEQKALLLATKLGPGTHTGTIAGVEVRSVLRESVGPDMSDPEAGIHEQSRDFKVTYLEPN